MFVDRRAWQPLNTALSSNRAHMSSSSQPQSRKRRRSPQNSDSDDDDRGHARSQPLPYSEPFPCIFRHKNCMLAFKSVQTLRTHLNNAHSDDVPLASSNYDKCDTCSNFFVKLGNDNLNLRRHRVNQKSCKGKKVRPEGNNVSPPRHPSLPSSDSSFDSLDSPTAPVSLSSSPPQPEGEGSSSLPPISGLDLPIAGEMVRRLAAKGATVNIPVHAQEGWIEANKGVWAGAMALAGDAGAEEVSRILMDMHKVPRLLLQRMKMRGGKDARRGASARQRVFSQAKERVEGFDGEVEVRGGARRSGKNVQRARARKARKLMVEGAQFGNQKKRSSRAAQALLRDDIPQFLDEASAEVLRSLHPEPIEGSAPLPGVPEGTPKVLVVDEAVLGRVIQSMCDGAMGGISAWRAEMVLPLWGDLTCRQAIVNVVKHILNANLTPLARGALLSSMLTTLKKDNGGVRPIAMVEFFYKLAGRYGLEMQGEEVKAKFGKVQLGVGHPGGVEKALHALRAALQEIEDSILISDDLPNAYNLRDRARLLQLFFAEADLSPLFHLVHMAYGAESHLYKVEEDRLVWVHPSLRGVKQGDPLSLLLFALSIQKCFEQADIEGVTAVAICDDLEIVGSVEDAFKAYDRVVEAEVAEKIDRVSNKRFVLWIHNRAPPQDLQELCDVRGLKLISGAEEADGTWKGGCATVLGAPFSANREDINAFVLKKVAAHLPFFEALKHKDLGAQVALSLLRLGGASRMNFLSRVVPPSDLRQGARTFDEMVLESLEEILEIELARDEEGAVKKGSPVVCDLRRAVRNAGFGFSSIEFLSPIAYYASNAQALSLTGPALGRYLEQGGKAARAQEREAGGVTAGDQFIELEAAREHILATAFEHPDVDNDADLRTAGLSTTIESFASAHHPEDPSWQDLCSRKKHQRRLTHAVQDRLYTIEKLGHDDYTAARHKSQCGKGAATLKTLLPFNHGHQHSDTLVRSYYRLLLGIAQAGMSPKDCPLCGAQGIHHEHALTCSSFRKLGRQGHDCTQLAIANVYKFLLLWATALEPKCFDNGLRTDIQILDDAGKLKEIDVVTSLPTAESYLKDGAFEELRVANNAAANKVGKHKKHCKERKVRFVPFSVEIFGNLQAEAVKEINYIAKRLAEKLPIMFRSQSAAARYVTGVVSTALQRGNANSFKLFVRECHKKERQANGGLTLWKRHYSPPLPANHSTWSEVEAKARSYPELHKLRSSVAAEDQSSHSPQVSPSGLDTHLITQECEKLYLTVEDLGGAGDCLPLDLKRAVEYEKLVGAPKFKDAQDVRNRVTDYALELLRDFDGNQGRLSVLFPNIVHPYLDDEMDERARGEVVEAIKSWCKDARTARRHVGVTFVRVFGDLVAANVEIGRVATFSNGDKEVRWEKMPFDGSYGHHLDEEFGWSGRNASEVVGEGKRLLRVAYVAYQRTAEQIAGGAAKSVGHYLLVRDLQSECHHVTRTGLTNVGPAQDGFY